MDDDKQQQRQDIFGRSSYRQSSALGDIPKVQRCLLVIILRTISANQPVFMHGIELKTHLLEYTCPTPPAAVLPKSPHSHHRYMHMHRHDDYRTSYMMII